MLLLSLPRTAVAATLSCDAAVVSRESSAAERNFIYRKCSCCHENNEQSEINDSLHAMSHLLQEVLILLFLMYTTEFFQSNSVPIEIEMARSLSLGEEQ